MIPIHWRRSRSCAGASLQRESAGGWQSPPTVPKMLDEQREEGEMVEGRDLVRPEEVGSLPDTPTFLRSIRSVQESRTRPCSLPAAGGKVTCKERKIIPLSFLGAPGICKGVSLAECPPKGVFLKISSLPAGMILFPSLQVTWKCRFWEDPPAGRV